MQALITGAALPAAEITPDLFKDFVAWIDRCDNTTKSYLRDLKQFYKWMQLHGVKNPGRQDVINYRDHLINTGFKASTVTAYLRSVKQFFAWAAAAGYYPNIAQNIHAPKVERGIHKKDAFTAAESLQIEKSISLNAELKRAAAKKAARDSQGLLKRGAEQDARLRAIYLLAVNAGLRTIEISRARVKDLELKRGRYYLYVWGKGRSEADQKKPLPAEVATAILDYLKTRGRKPSATDPLFVSTGNRSGGKKIAASTISTMLKRAMQAAGFNSDRLTAHSLRHTAGTAAQEVCGDLYKTQQYMRHASPVTTESYLHNKTDAQQAELADKVYNYLHGIRETGENRLLDLFRMLPPKAQSELIATAERMNIKAQYTQATL